MNTKIIQPVEFERVLRQIERARKEEAQIISLHELKTEPVEDFRVLIANEETIEEMMSEKAKTLGQKKRVLELWQKTKTLLSRMIERMEEDLAKAERVQAQVDEAKDKVLHQRMKSGLPPYGL